MGQFNATAKATARQAATKGFEQKETKRVRHFKEIEQEERPMGKGRTTQSKLLTRSLRGLAAFPASEHHR